jgi:cystathionine beta-lyase/cystathionine gamma-synthase
MQETKQDKWGFSTVCIHGNASHYDTTGSLNVPIFQNAAFAHTGEARFDYSRQQNPTREYLEQTVARLESGSADSGAEALALSSGMAAISVVLELFQGGDHLLLSSDIYGGTDRIVRTLGARRGITADFVDTTDPSLLSAAVTPQTKALFVETPGNPLLRVTDIAAAAEFCKQHDLLLIVDNTFLTPYFQKPLALGADIVVHSGTKFLGGHHDVLAGFVITQDADLAARLRKIYITTGACLGPFDSFLLIRSLKTLPLRMDRHQATALAIARWLETHPKVRSVQYPGLPAHPGYEISMRQTTGFGAMLSFSVSDAQAAEALLHKITLIQYAESLGGAETLLTYPIRQTHAEVPTAEQQARGITDTLLRLSVGLEDADDLIADLAQALDSI